MPLYKDNIWRNPRKKNPEGGTIISIKIRGRPEGGCEAVTLDGQAAEVKQKRAQGGCLGTKSRRKT